jgi:hypothetical protein
MDAIVLDDISFRADTEKLQKRLRVRDAQLDGFNELVAEAEAIARPKALYKVAYIEARDEDRVVIDGVAFESRVLQVNLEDVHRVFPFVATCGRELYDWVQAQDDMLAQFYADAISESALNAARQALKAELKEQYRIERSSKMNPGSLEDWPIREQRPLFDLLGDPEEAIGVFLTDTMLMVPSKSVSGIRFPTEQSFESCQLCPREACPSRQAPYDPDLYEEKYA